MSLTIKQRAKVNAALCIIHDQGGDADAVTELARTIMATGHNPAKAYERALNQYAESNPEIGATIGKAVNLIEASDDRTVAHYDAALSSYIETGDESSLNALAPMVAEDVTALAVRNGEEPPQFGQEPQPALTPQTTSTFAFNTQPSAELVDGRPVVGRAADGSAIVRTTSQISLAPSPAGIVAPKAAREGERHGYTGFAPTPGPGAHAPNFAAAKEAARAAAANPGRAIIGDASQGA